MGNHRNGYQEVSSKHLSAEDHELILPQEEEEEHQVQDDDELFRQLELEFGAANEWTISDKLRAFKRKAGIAFACVLMVFLGFISGHANDNGAIGDMLRRNRGHDPVWSYRSIPDPEENSNPVQVCLMTHSETSPHKMSLFIRNYLRLWGSQLELRMSKPEVKRLLTEYYAKGEIDESEFQPLTHDHETCPDGWPKMYLRYFRFVPDSLRFDAPVAALGDEGCHCDPRDRRLCGAGGPALFRQYFSTRYYGKASYIPLGPRFEWQATTPDEIIPASQRSIPFNFQGSLTSSSRGMLVHTLRDPEIRKKYPIITEAEMDVQGKFEKFVTNGAGYSVPRKYREIVLDSVFTLCPSGGNPEAFRIYEAVDAGSIPIMVLDEFYFEHNCAGSFVPFFKSGAPFVFLESWDHLPAFISKVMQNKALLDQKQRELAKWRGEYFASVAQSFDCKMMSHFHDPATTNLTRFCGPKSFPPISVTYDEKINYNFIGRPPLK